jgi:hypothetical protein
MDFNDNLKLYHWVRPDFQGTTLMPGNMLHTISAELDAEFREKYADRPELMEETIPALDHCLWNDVLQFVAVHPIKTRQALAQAGRIYHRSHYFVIDPTDLAKKDTTIYLASKGPKTPDKFLKFCPESLERHTEITEGTLQYYRQTPIRNPLVYAGFPHILYKGTIDVSNTPIITI